MKLIGLVIFAAVLLTAVVGDLTTADRGCSSPAPTPSVLVVQDLGECRFPHEHGAYPDKSAKPREALHASGGDKSPNREAQCIAYRTPLLCLRLNSIRRPMSRPRVKRCTQQSLDRFTNETSSKTTLDQWGGSSDMLDGGVSRKSGASRPVREYQVVV